jgi:general secretion pathway protein C
VFNPARLQRLVSENALRRGVLLLLVLWVAWSVLSLLLLALRPASIEPGAAVVDAAPPESPGVRIEPERLQGWRLFGAAAEPEALPEVAEPALSVEEESAEETRLPLALQGVFVARDEQRSRAVIAHKGAQDSYRVGDELPTGPRVKLARVLNDRVLIDNKGTIEKLLLYEDELDRVTPPARQRQTAATARPGVARPAPRPAAQPPTPTIIRPASMLGGNRLSQMKTLYETVRLVPAVDDQRNVVGYQVQPGPNAAMFQRLGLMRGDIVTHLNGTPVGQIEADQVRGMVADGGDFAEITVRRGSQTHRMRLDLDG